MSSEDSFLHDANMKPGQQNQGTSDTKHTAPYKLTIIIVIIVVVIIIITVIIIIYYY